MRTNKSIVANRSVEGNLAGLPARGTAINLRINLLNIGLLRYNAYKNIGVGVDVRKKNQKKVKI